MKELKPFDLEAARRGDPICDKQGVPMYFVGVRSRERIVVEEDRSGQAAMLHSLHHSDLFMAPKKRTVWVNLHKSGEYVMWRTKDLAERGAARSMTAIAVPVEIEE